MFDFHFPRKKSFNSTRTSSSSCSQDQSIPPFSLKILLQRSRFCASSLVSCYPFSAEQLKHDAIV